jgi:hypothetical protein
MKLKDILTFILCIPAIILLSKALEVEIAILEIVMRDSYARYWPMESTVIVIILIIMALFFTILRFINLGSNILSTIRKK